MTRIRFETEQAEAAAEKDEPPIASLLRAARAHPGEWAKVPAVIATSYLRSVKTYANFFDVPLEIRIIGEERWLRYAWSARSPLRARGLQSTRAPSKPKET